MQVWTLAAAAGSSTTGILRFSLTVDINCPDGWEGEIRGCRAAAINPSAGQPGPCRELPMALRRWLGVQALV